MLGLYFYFILQKIYWPLLRLTLFTMFRVEINDPHGSLRHVASGTLVIANHKTPLDPFIISILFPWMSPVYPIRFMAEFRKFAGQPLEFLRKIGVIYVIYFLFGAFSSRRGQGIERALALPVYFLNHKQSVLIFPEGSMVRGRELGTIRRGAGVLAAQTGRSIVPIALHYRRGTYRLSVGEIFTLEPHLSEDQSTQKMSEALGALFQPIVIR